jgi:hypothetical protein
MSKQHQGRNDKCTKHPPAFKGWMKLLMADYPEVVQRSCAVAQAPGKHFWQWNTLLRERSLYVLKTRGVKHFPEIHPFDITDDGIEFKETDNGS